ncbi:MAG: aminomethyltransferase family protein [Actinomycetota bacterium]
MAKKASWERVNYYSSQKGDDELRPYGWAGKHWSSAVSVEHLATRTSAGLFDESSFAKILVSGEQAAEFLNFACANDVVKGVGRTVYTQALNSRGGIESDFTVTQIGDAVFFIVTGTAFGGHDKGWLEKLARENNFTVHISDVTESLACFGIWGPRSREILQSVTTEDLSHEKFPFMRSREILIEGITVRATRITYVGELGWELYLPVEQGELIWKSILEAGKNFGLEVCGYKAIESLRLEKGYRAWSGEISTETNPWEAGLGFAISSTKENFFGHDSLVQAKESQSRKLVVITFDDIRRVPLGNEPIRIGGKIVGRVKSGGQGYSIGKAIAYAYLPIDHSAPKTRIEVEFFGQWVEGRIESEPLFDPTNQRIRS